MQRELILTGGTRPHPFRRHFRREVARQQQVRDDSDLKLFVLSFTAFFVCFATFIF